jgi:hypothetical protein
VLYHALNLLERSGAILGRFEHENVICFDCAKLLDSFCQQERGFQNGKRKTKMYTVAIFLIDRAYGGSEEGGWYYECGEPQENMVQHFRGFIRKAWAEKYADFLNETVCKELNVGRRPISSVLSQGLYQAQVCEGLPKAYPETRPHYE